MLLVILAIGIALVITSLLPTRRTVEDTSTISWDTKLLPKYNTTCDLHEVDSSHHVTVTLSLVHEDPGGTPSENGLHYYFFETAAPDTRHFENWTNVYNASESTRITISEEGHWFVFIENQGNQTLGFRISLDRVEYAEVSSRDASNLTPGAVLVIYSLLFIFILFTRDRYPKRKPPVGPEVENGKKP